MATTRLMPLHIGKGQTAGDAIKRALGYIKDPVKTENGILVTSYGCTPQTAEAEFMILPVLWKKAWRMPGSQCAQRGFAR